ncbi:MAG TPA: hypothetical protein VEL75_01330 [Candidatus Methylomirabilis sp.]|nr:hypothetical protein [Candidatus Methylomirabilis sp.]
MTNRSAAALLVLALVAAPPVIGALPNQIGAVRAAGVSLLWWYTGLVAPLVAALVALAALPDPPRRDE